MAVLQNSKNTWLSEDRDVTISRAAGWLTFPANFMLVAAMNPHPCGFYGDSKRQCRCSSRQIENYRQRISGPLLDRIDLHVEVPLVDFRDLSSNTATGDKSETIRERVVQARKIQDERFRKSGNATNSAMNPRQMKAHCQIDAEGTGYLEHAMEEMNFSARAHDRILKVARTLADLAGSKSIRLTTSSKPSSSTRWIASYSPEFAFVAIAGYGST